MSRTRFSVAVLAAIVLLSGSAFAESSPRQFRHHHHNGLKLCVAYSQLADCKDMVDKHQLARHHEADPEDAITCVAAPDKISCISRIIHGDADWMILGPEELYVAQRFLPDSLVVVSELRSEQYKSRDYQYSPVAVVRKSSQISSISDLRSKRSCHTGFGKTAGWRVPFSTLFVNSQLRCPRNVSAVEADLSVVSSYFSAACAPGRWVSDPTQDRLLKQKYSNLCSLCSDPATCAKSDKHADYAGALRCLTENSGDVAWTKLDEVESFFQSGANADEYELLCVDNTTQPIPAPGQTSPKPCTWAHRPWYTIVMTQHFAHNVNVTRALQQQLTQLQELGQKSSEEPLWLKNVLEFYNSSDVIVHKPLNHVKLQTPQAYLQPSGYSNTIWHPSCGITKKNLKITVFNQLAMERCEALKLAAIGQRISPGFSCILSAGGYFGTQMVVRGDADIIISGSGYHAAKIENSGLIPLGRVSVPAGGSTSEPYIYSLAVISAKVASKFTAPPSLAPLRGLRSCHGDIHSTSGWQVPQSVLRNAGLITGENCSLTEITDFFSGMCVPGGAATHPKLCTICAGDGTGSNDPLATPEAKCAGNSNERYYNSNGALRCLEDDAADVAFIDHLTLLKIHNRKTKDADRSEQLLCPNGTVASLHDWKDCYWGKTATQKILVRGDDASAILRDDIRLSLQKVHELFAKGKKLDKVLRLAGPYFGTDDLILDNQAIGLVDERTIPAEQKEKESAIYASALNCKKMWSHPKVSYKTNAWLPNEQF